MVKTINWFEIPVNDLGRASKFCTEALGTVLGDMDGPNGPMKVFQNDGMPVGALVKGDHNSPSNTGPLVYFGTEDIDAALDRVGTGGGKVVVTKMSIGAYGHIGQFIDTEGNRIALHSN